MEAFLIIIAWMLVGIAIGALLAIGDTSRNIHGPAMSGPKLQKSLVRKYRVIAIVTFCAGFGLSVVANLRLFTWFGLLSALVGVAIFNKVDRRLTRHLG